MHPSTYHLPAWLVAAVLVATLALSACSPSDPSANLVPVEPDTSTVEGSVTPQPGVAFGVELSAEEAAAIKESAASTYQGVASEEIVIQSGTPIGESGCMIFSTKSGVSSVRRVAQLADGTRLAHEENDIDAVLQPCFYEAGLNPTPNDVALIAASMSSSLLSLTVVNDLPSIVVSNVPDKLRADNLLDFANYRGPVAVDGDGNPVVRFVAEDRTSTWYVVTVTASADGSTIDQIAPFYTA